MPPTLLLERLLNHLALPSLLTTNVQLSTLNSRSLSAKLDPRRSTNTILWCAPGSQTYVILNFYYAVAGDGIRDLLDEAVAGMVNNIDFNGDGLIPGVFNWLGEGDLKLNVWNSNNHQTTWGVLRAALLALKDYMSHNVYGTAYFTINDGTREVGEGLVGMFSRRSVRDSIWILS